MVATRIAGREGVVCAVTDDDSSESKHLCRRVNNSENKKDLKSLKMNESMRASQQQYIFS